MKMILDAINNIKTNLKTKIKKYGMGGKNAKPYEDILYELDKNIVAPMTAINEKLYRIAEVLGFSSVEELLAMNVKEYAFKARYEKAKASDSVRNELDAATKLLGIEPLERMIEFKYTAEKEFYKFANTTPVSSRHIVDDFMSILMHLLDEFEKIISEFVWDVSVIDAHPTLETACINGKQATVLKLSIRVSGTVVNYVCFTINTYSYPYSTAFGNDKLKDKLPFGKDNFYVPGLIFSETLTSDSLVISL